MSSFFKIEHSFSSCNNTVQPVEYSLLFFIIKLQDTLQAIRVLRATSDELQDVGAVISKGSDAKELALYDILIQCAKAELSMLPTTMEIDENLMRSKITDARSSREGLAIQFRISKKRLLQEAIRNMEKRMNQAK